MAVFKVTSYTKHKGGAKASIRYIERRPGKEGQRVTRQLFGVDGAMTRKQAYQLIDEAKKNMRFFRLVISPDPIREDSEKDLRLWEITKQTMQTLEARLNQAVAWVAAQHDDHAPNRHVHIVAAVKGRLKVSDLKLLRQSATQAVHLQRLQLDLDQTRDYRRDWCVRSPSAKIHATSRQKTGRSPRRGTFHQAAAPIPVPFGILACTCPHCFASQSRHTTNHTHRCQSCGRRLHQEQKVKLIRERKESSWEL